MRSVAIKMRPVPAAARTSKIGHGAARTTAVGTLGRNTRANSPSRRVT